MERENLDRILAEEDEMVPTSGFVAAVMDRVEAEATEPKPIPFPWKRAAPGIALAAGVLGWGAVELARYAAEAASGLLLPDGREAAVLTFRLTPYLEQAGWVALSLALSLGSGMLARRLGGRSGLL